MTDVPQTLERITVGSINAGKIEAVRRALAAEPIARRLFCGSVVGVETASGVADNPLGFPETIAGAANRARAAYAAAGEGWGIGIESGAVALLPERGTFFHFDVCCVFDGRSDWFGVSSGFEYPRRLGEAVYLRKEEFQRARQYIDTAPDLSQRGGVIGVLSAGITDRIVTAEQAARLAIIRALDPAGAY